MLILGFNNGDCLLSLGARISWLRGSCFCCCCCWFELNFFVFVVIVAGGIVGTAVGGNEGNASCSGICSGGVDINR